MWLLNKCNRDINAFKTEQRDKKPKWKEAVKHRKHLQATSYCTNKNYDTKDGYMVKKKKIGIAYKFRNNAKSPRGGLVSFKTRSHLFLQSLLSNVTQWKLSDWLFIIAFSFFTFFFFFFYLQGFRDHASSWSQRTGILNTDLNRFKVHIGGGKQNQTRKKTNKVEIHCKHSDTGEDGTSLKKKRQSNRREWDSGGGTEASENAA